MENGLAPSVSFHRKHFVHLELSQECSCEMCGQGRRGGGAQQKHSLCAAGKTISGSAGFALHSPRRVWLSFSHTLVEEEAMNAPKPMLGLTTPVQRKLQACAHSGKHLQVPGHWTPARFGKFNETIRWLLCCGDFPFTHLVPESTLCWWCWWRQNYWVPPLQTSEKRMQVI